MTSLSAPPSPPSSMPSFTPTLPSAPTPPALWDDEEGGLPDLCAEDFDAGSPPVSWHTLPPPGGAVWFDNFGSCKDLQPLRRRTCDPRCPVRLPPLQSVSISASSATSSLQTPSVTISSTTTRRMDETSSSTAAVVQQERSSRTRWFKRRRPSSSTTSRLPPIACFFLRSAEAP